MRLVARVRDRARRQSGPVPHLPGGAAAKSSGGQFPVAYCSKLERSDGIGHVDGHIFEIAVTSPAENLTGERR